MRKKQKPKYKFGQLVRTSVIKELFSNADSGNFSYLVNTITEVIPSYRINYLPDRYKENLSRSTNLTLDENEQILMKLNLFQSNNN